MIEIRNLFFQPLTFHLTGEKRSLYLNPRERRQIEESDISLEIEKAEKRKFISLRKLSEPEFKVLDEKIGKKTTEKKKITDKPIKDESQK